MNTTPEIFTEFLAQIARRFPRNDDVEALKSALQSSDHPFWSDLAKHFGLKVKKIFSFLKTITVGVVKAKNTDSCFTNETRYYYRDSDLDRYLPKNQPTQPESKFAVCELTQAVTFKEMAEQILGVQGDIKTLAKLLKERGLATTLQAIEVLIERQENGEDIGLLTNNWANFFFVENEDGESVSVVLVYRHARRWVVHRSSLGYNNGWAAVRRFFLRNFSGTL
ncbi:MAG TPA: hypothetical protein VJC04_00545 [Candidatus Paceibacterota bacterium]